MRKQALLYQLNYVPSLVNHARILSSFVSSAKAHSKQLPVAIRCSPPARLYTRNNNNNEADATTHIALDSTIPVKYNWKDFQQHRAFFDRIARDLNIKHHEDWYHIRGEDVMNRGGTELLRKHYQSSLVKALAAVYPDVEWLPWRFSRVPSGFWDDTNNQRQYFDWVARQLDVHKPEDWYRVRVEDIESRCGGGLLYKYYQSSLFKALSAVYPDVRWLPWRFSQVPRGFWDDTGNHRQYFDWLAEQLGVKSPEDWYQVRREDVEARDGFGILKRPPYRKSLFKALSIVYPDVQWLPWKFARVPKGFWDDLANQRRYFDWAAEQLGIRRGVEEDWYRIRAEDIESLYGYGLLNEYYKRSLPKALAAVYPEIQWQVWRFARTPKHLLKNTAILKDCIETMAKQLGIGINGVSAADDDDDDRNSSDLDEWYRVSVAQVARLGGLGVVQQHGGLCKALQIVYPEHKWDPTKFQAVRGKRSEQRWLKITAQQLFPGKEILEDFNHPELLFGDTSEKMQLDLYIPSVGLAFEYQGEHHFRDIHFFGSRAQFQQRDEEKARTCQRVLGITLVSVPYWWDHSKESLAATIHALRPDLGLDAVVDLTSPAAKPIPKVAPAPATATATATAISKPTLTSRV